MPSAICGGMITWTEFRRLGVNAPMMALVRKRENVEGKYRYKIIDLIGDRWWWEGDA